MMIGKFNRFFARHGRLAFFVILLLIGLPMAFLFGQRTDALSKADLTGTRVGYVDGEPMSHEEFMRHLVAFDLQSFLRDQRSYDINRTEVMKAFAPAVFTRAHLLRLAKERHLDAVSNDEITKRVRNMQIFRNKDTGEFDQNVFNMFKLRTLPHYGITPAQFDQIMREDIAIERIYNPYVEGITVNNLELRFEGLDHSTEVTARIAHYDYLHFTADLKLADADLKAYYEANKEGLLKVPAKKQIAVVYTDANDFMPKLHEVTEEEMQAYWDAHKDTDEDIKEHQVKASHILIRVNEGDDEATIAKKKQQAEALLKQALTPGTDFAELAKKNSQASWNAKDGGAVEFFGPRSRGPWYPALAPLKDGQVYDKVVRDFLGFNVLKKTGDRDIYHPLVENGNPYIKNKIQQKLQAEADDKDLHKEAMAYYEAHKASMFTEPEIHTAHILIKTPYDASDEVLAEKKQLAEDILAQCKKPDADFAELAKKYSEDGSRSLGGDIGWATQFSMYNSSGLVREYFQAALPLKDGEISGVVKSQFGYHIIKKLGQRPLTRPFDEVKGRVFYLVKQDLRQNARIKARDLVHKCAVAIFARDDIFNLTGDARLQAFLAAAHQFEKDEGAKLHFADSEFFAADAETVPGIPGDSKELAEAVQRLSNTDPFTMEAITATTKGREGTPATLTSDYAYLACFKAAQDAYAPTYDEVADAVKTDVTKERGLAAAREKAREDADKVAKALAAGEGLDKAADGINLTEVKPFTAAQGPTESEWGNYGEAISDLAIHTDVDKVSSVKDVDDGALFLIVTKRDLDMSSFVEQKDMYSVMYRHMLQSAAVDALRDRLTKETKWEFTPRWDNLLGDKPAKDDGATGDGTDSPVEGEPAS